MEVGDVARIPTWHEQDYGIALSGDLVVMSQPIDVSDRSLSRVTISALADVDEGADLKLELDLDDDGSVEHELSLNAADWTSLSESVTFAAQPQRIRFRLVKTGPGVARLAQLKAFAW